MRATKHTHSVSLDTGYHYQRKRMDRCWPSGHAVNQLYDLLYMMGRDDIAVEVGGEGGNLMMVGLIQMLVSISQQLIR